MREVRRVCDVLQIPLSTVNFATEYWDNVFSAFLAELRAGPTPNPDVLCNREIKFKAFLEHATSLGARYIATGHYAGVAESDGLYRLIKARDTGSDRGRRDGGAFPPPAAPARSGHDVLRTGC